MEADTNVCPTTRSEIRISKSVTNLKPCGFVDKTPLASPKADRNVCPTVKSEIRISKSETNLKPQIRMFETLLVRSLGFVSDFGFRASDLRCVSPRLRGSILS